MASYDLFGPLFKADPFGTWAEMRRDAPVYGHVSPNGVTTWYVTRYDDVLAVLHDNERFVKDVTQTRLPAERPLTPQSPSIHQQINENMLFSDPPDHTRLRALVNQAFTPRRVEQTVPRVQQITDELLDAVAAARQMDVIADLALPLPVRVICEMLGIPVADMAQVTDWSQAIIAPGSKGLTTRSRRQKLRAFVAYLQELFERRRQQPEDDLLSALVLAEQDGDRLSGQELSSMVALLLVTGHETTVNLIGNGVLALLRHPAQLARLVAEPGLWGTAVEELLRFDGPVETSTTRWVRVDTEFGGQQMRRGDVMRVVLSSANRDSAHFACSEALDVTRQPNRHLAFGHGIHYCLGAPLARVEGVVAMGSLFGRWPQLRLAEPPEALHWRAGVLFRGVERLPVCW
jgi:cytochrome P450